MNYELEIQLINYHALAGPNKLEYGNVSFSWGGGGVGGTEGGKYPPENQDNSTNIWHYAKIEPGPYWLEACTFATVPTLLPQAIT